MIPETLTLPYPLYDTCYPLLRKSTPMHADNFVLNDYLKRINYTGTPQADLATLRDLMHQQLLTVPFENLDVQAGKIVSLVPEDIVAKIVYQPRGGYCYEVNGLFAMALAALGIPYQFANARPLYYPVKRPKSHLVIIATLAGEQWLCDLGFGSYGIREPMSLGVLDSDVRQSFDTFRLSKLNERDYQLEALVEGEWAKQYSFDLYEPEWIDFAPANYMNSTHPDAIFVKKPLIVLHNTAGRKILFGNTLTIITQDSVTRQEVNSSNYPALLQTHFGLVG